MLRGIFAWQSNSLGHAVLDADFASLSRNLHSVRLRERTLIQIFGQRKPRPVVAAQTKKLTVRIFRQDVDMNLHIGRRVAPLFRLMHAALARLTHKPYCKKKKGNR